MKTKQPAAPSTRRQSDARQHGRRASKLVAALAIGLAGLAAASVVLAQPQRPQQQTAKRWVSGELLIGLRAGVGPAGRFKLFRDHGATYVDDVGQKIRVVRIRVPELLLQIVKRRLARRPEVKFVEENFEFDPAVTPNDAQYGSQWHLPKIDAPQAWDLTQGSASSVIAILDTGVDSSHPDLAAKLVPGYNFFNNNTNTTDTIGHGTEVAGAAGALTNNGVGVAGVAGNAPIMPVRVTSNTGAASSARIASGIMWAADHGARVINLSFNGMAGNATIGAAAEYAVNKGVLVVAASGNCACADPTPENPFILSVGATDQADGLAYYSSTGDFVDLSAPGDNILTTGRFGAYNTVSGTSLASPVVAGVAALMFAANPTLTPAQATLLLESTAVDVGGSGYTPSFGYGRVDAAAAVTAAANYSIPADTTAPTVAVTTPLANASVSGTVIVDVAASDNVGVVKVDLYVDGVFFVSETASPYSFAWDTTTLPNGAHTLQAVATDAANNSTSTDVIPVTVANTPPDTTPPTVSFGSPANGATVSGTTTVSANAADDVGVVSVEFSIDGAVVATASAAPYAFTWNTTASSNGSHTLQAVATDAAGNASSVTRVVNVANTPPDTTPPTVAIGAPAAGATVSGTATVSATAADNVAVAKVELFVDGALNATDTTVPYSFAWNTTVVGDGTHTLQVVATDTAGNAASVTRAVTVANNVNQAPVASDDSFSAPYRSKSSYTAQVFAVLANDSDADGSLNTRSIVIVSAPDQGGSVTVRTNGTVAYTPKKGFRGVETFRYTVKDNNGATSNAATVTVTVQ
jgi:subtilisin family serine protease